MNLNNLSIIEAIEGLKKKKFSAKELVNSCLVKIRKDDNKIKAFITVCDKEAILNAKKIKYPPNEKYPLLGVPFAIKDNFCTKGILTTASSKILENYIPVYDATVVKKLKKAGAIILGKTNLDAWAHGSSTETSDFFTTRNPWNTNRLPGGSSGGSAAAIAADMTIGAIGSETAGSIRQPAAWCGVVGLKPTYGRVSRFGLIAMASSMDCPGPLAKTVKDAALVLNVIEGKDKFDATTFSSNKVDYLKSINGCKSLKGIKFGIPRQYILPQMEREVVESFVDSTKIIEKLGGQVIEIDLMEPKYSVAVYTILQRAEVSSNLARYDGIRYGKSRSFFGTEAKRRIMLGTYTLSAGFYDKYYIKALKARKLICEDFEKAFKQVDLIISPTSPCTALEIGATKDSYMFGELQDILVEASSLAGLPGINVPAGFSKNRLPIGLQFIGPKFSEELILKSAFLYEYETQWTKYKPQI